MSGSRVTVYPCQNKERKVRYTEDKEKELNNVTDLKGRDITYSYHTLL